MKRTLAVVILSVVGRRGCAARGVRIAELKDQPTKYDDKTVSVTGVVTSSWGIPLVPFQLYNVDDGTRRDHRAVAVGPHAGEGRARPGEGQGERGRRRSAAARSACTSRKKTGRSGAESRSEVEVKSAHAI